LEPVLTEKALRIQEQDNQYVFKVAKSANKIQIKQAIASRFGVTVKSVRVANVKGKPRQRFTRAGRVSGFTASYKKAFVTLEEGNTLDFLENV
ncbi:MAG: 50S ribosomal protein L23, partial [Calditrichota bacterium]